MNGIEKKYIKNIVAGILVICMAITDTTLVARSFSGVDHIDVEEHDMKTYLADGNYDGSDSSYEISNKDDDEIYTYQDIYMFNILEIIPEDGLATVGYSIEGFEPITFDEGISEELKKKLSTPEMRHAYMDALMNEDICGGSDVQPLSIISNAYTQFSDTRGNKAFGYEKDIWGNEKREHTGYYKYIGPGEGYYAKVDNTTDQFISKFSTKSVGHGTFDYIWQGTTLSYDELKDSDLIRKKDGKYIDIPVKNHKKFSYVNNNLFFDDFYTGQDGKKISYDEWKETHRVDLRTKVGEDVDDKDISWADVIIVTDGLGVDSRSAYALYLRGKHKYDYDNSSYDSFWQNKVSKMKFPELDKFSYTLQIYDRVAVKEDVAFMAEVDKGFCEYKDSNGQIIIDSNMRKLLAMLFLVNDGSVSGGSGRKVFTDFLSKYVDHHDPETKQWDPQGISQSLDACSNKFNYDNNREILGEIDPRYMFNDFPRAQCSADEKQWEQKCYYDLNGKKIWRNDDHTENWIFKTTNRSNMTDYIYIAENDDEKNGIKAGNFMVNTKYSGEVFFVDFDNDVGSFIHRYTSWQSMANKYNNSERWPWDISEGNCLQYWWFGSGATDQGWHLPIYYHYYAWGSLKALSSPGKNTTYKNQSFAESNGKYKADYLKDAIKNREVKREYSDPTHIIEGERKKVVIRHFYLSVNIVNGDGVNKTTSGNKVMYINDYEVDERTDLPINFKVRTSEDIAKIELFKGSASDTNRIALYEPKTGNDITAKDKNLEFTKAGGSTITLYNETEYSEPEGVPIASKNKPKKEGPYNLYIYSYGAESETKDDGTKQPKKTTVTAEDGSTKEIVKMTSIPNEIKTSMLTEINTKFILRVSIKMPSGEYKSVDDEIYVVKRGFFGLD